MIYNPERLHGIAAYREISRAFSKGDRVQFKAGKPTEDAFVESFNGTFRAECLDARWLMNLKDAKHLIEASRREYNPSKLRCANNLAGTNYRADPFELL